MLSTSTTTTYLGFFIVWFLLDLYLYNKNSTDYYLYAAILNICIQIYVNITSPHLIKVIMISPISTYYSYFLMVETFKVHGFVALITSIGTSSAFNLFLCLGGALNDILPRLSGAINLIELYNNNPVENIRSPKPMLGNIADMFACFIPESKPISKPIKVKAVDMDLDTDVDENYISEIMAGIKNTDSDVLEQIVSNVTKIVDTLDDEALSEMEEEEEKIIKAVTSLD